MRCYVDTSAMAKLIVEEAESGPLADFLDAPEIDVVSSLLLETELRRVATRMDRSQQSVTELLERVTLFDVTPAIYRAAGLLPGPGLRSLDAVHVSCASHIGVDAMITYDARMADAAASSGLRVLAPA